MRKMKKIRTHYDNLQVVENASPEVIKGAYRYLSQKWHPDKNPNQREKAENNIRIINKAYEVLSDPIKRSEHNEWIRQEKAKLQAQFSPTPPPNSFSMDFTEKRLNSELHSAMWLYRWQFLAPVEKRFSSQSRPWMRYCLILIFSFYAFILLMNENLV